MRYMIIDPRSQVVSNLEADDFKSALAAADLKSFEVDHGLLASGLGIVVAEYGLYDQSPEVAYFAIDGNVYAGPALLYGIGDEGETIDLDRDEVLSVVWFPSREKLEIAIQQGIVRRPQVTVGGEVFWSWPQPKPDLDKLVQISMNREPKG